MENRNVVRMVYLSRKSTSEHTGHDIVQVLTKESIVQFRLVISSSLAIFKLMGREERVILNVLTSLGQTL